MQEKKVDCLVVVAEEKMIGYLKPYLENTPAQIKWLAKDYSHFSAQEIHEKLAEQQLVPAPKKPTAS